MNTETIKVLYYHDIESTNKVLKKDENGVLWYNTGDLVYQNEKQELFLVGRVKRMELTVDEAGNPAKLVPDEISRIISEIDYVDKCEVITVADEKVYNRPIAFVVLKDSDDSEEIIKKKILDYCNKNLAAYKVPKCITFIDAIPMNSSSNKVNYKELADIYKSILE